MARCSGGWHDLPGERAVAGDDDDLLVAGADGEEFGVVLLEDAQDVRDWLECAARCECPDLDQCPLFDDPAIPPPPPRAQPRPR